MCFNQTGDISTLNDRVIYSHNKYAYIHIYMFMQDTYWRNKLIRRRKTSLTKYLPLTLLQGFERVVQGLRVRVNWRPNITEIFWPHCYDRQLCVFLVLLMLNRRPRGPLCWVLAFFTASYQQLLWSPNSIGVPEGPLGRVWLSLPHLVSSDWNSISCNSTGRNWTRRNWTQLLFVEFNSVI